MECCLPDFLAGDVDCGQGWTSQGGKGYVVNSHDRNIFRDFDPGLFEGAHRPHSDKIAAAKDHSWSLRRTKNFLDGRSASIDPIVRVDHDQRLHTPSRQAGCQTSCNRCGSAISLWPSNYGCPSMPELHYVFNGLGYPSAVIHTNVAHELLSRALITKHNADSGAGQFMSG